MSLTTLLDVLAVGDSAAPSIIVGSGGSVFTRNQLLSLALRFAARLRNESGIQPGDVVTIAEPNTVAYVVAFLGVTFARAVAAPLNQNYTSEEFASYMEDAGSRLLVVGPEGNTHAEKASTASSIPILILESSFLSEVDDGTGNVDSLANFVKNNPPQPFDVALFLHTSGTTSKPKGVPLTHANLVASLSNIIATYEFTPSDRSLLVMPLFHVHGLMAGLLAPLAAGAAVVLPATGKFSATTFWQDAVQHKVTFFTAVPTIHQILVSRAETDFPRDTPPPLRVIRSCSSSLAPATLEKVEKAFGAPVLEAYAMTEASHQMTSNPLPHHGPRKPGTVGKAQGSVQIAILNSKCEVLPHGEIGEVCIRGPNVTTGYKDNPAANKEAFAGGWFHTGDQGYLDEEGYLTLTGRIKELINRGGEKISPLEVDAALLAHPLVEEAVSFAAPDDKYGEVVAAAVVLTDTGKKALASGEEDTTISADIKKCCGERLSAFKIPTRVFFTEQLPKNATGKIQRRFMVDAFITKITHTTQQPLSGSSDAPPSLPCDGAFIAARSLAALGIKYMFGVPGIPVTRVASAAQACGIRFIACRNEQSAGYAASAVAFLNGNGVPAALLTVSGPGVMHALPGVSNAKVNGWPVVVLSGSCDRSQLGKGAFQELDQVAAMKPHVKLAVQATSLKALPSILHTAYTAAINDRPGPVYIDLPADVLMQNLEEQEATAELTKISGKNAPQRERPQATQQDIDAAVEMLKTAGKPLIVIGKGAAYSGSPVEEAIRHLIDTWQIPFLSTSMGRGVVPDNHPLCVNAARSAALGGADVAVLFGARLNWQLHFGEEPKWSKDVKFVIVDVEPSEQSAAASAVTLKGDAAAVAEQLLLQGSSGRLGDYSEWVHALQSKVSAAREKLAAKLDNEVKTYPTADTTESPTTTPTKLLTHTAALAVIKQEISSLTPAPVVISEGANTMDQARLLLEPVLEPRCRLDAATWGVMGVGPGFALAAAVVHQSNNNNNNNRKVIAVEGDSAFGFSAMEVETACRYKMPITFLVFNNNGVYGGDRRELELRKAAERGLRDANHGWGEDPAPTAFVPEARYDLLATAFGGVGVHVNDVVGLRKALREALEVNNTKTTVIGIKIDPNSGVESGNVHAFNFLKK